MNPLSVLAAKHQQGNHPVFAPGPFLPILLINERGLQFNRILKRAQDMAAAALLNFEIGFETTVVPYDMNVEAEILGYKVSYHEEIEGIPVYPTIGTRWIKSAGDFDLPDDVTVAGRMPEILKAIFLIKKKSRGIGALGVFVPGPFTLTGKSDKYIKYMVEAGSDGIGVDQECDLDKVLQIVPLGLPLFSITGSYDLLSTATAEDVRAAARARLDKGITMVAPPADIYPPATIENIRAFVDELRVCRTQS